MPWALWHGDPPRRGGRRSEAAQRPRRRNTAAGPGLNYLLTFSPHAWGWSGGALAPSEPGPLDMGKISLTVQFATAGRRLALHNDICYYIVMNIMGVGMAQEKKKQLLVSVPESLHRAAKIKAAKTGKPMAQVMREALEKWVAKGDDND